MSMGHNDRKQRDLSAEIAAAFAAYLRRGGRVYHARIGETAMVEVPLNSKQGKKRTHELREVARGEL